jgi:hypothetical protein
MAFQPVFADFEQVMIPVNSERKIGEECLGADDQIKVEEGIIKVVPISNKNYSLDLDEQEDELSVYLGSVGYPKLCVMGIKYAENDVNESYSLFIYDSTLMKFRSSNVKIVNNPEFISGGILSEYRDGAVTHNDKICYSEKIKDYYFCERQEQFSDMLVRREICAESSCAEPEVIKKSGRKVVEAVVLEDKVNLLERSGASYFVKKKAYLVKGDKVSLIDYSRNDDGLYYKVNYVGKTKTQGWLSEKSIRF